MFGPSIRAGPITGLEVMNEVLNISVAEILPEPVSVLQQQGVPSEAISGSILEVAENACRLLATAMEPRAILAETDISTFQGVYLGQGLNSSRSPLAEIIPRSEALALFAVTVGPGVEHEISRHFSEHDYALAAALDAGASLAADQAADWIQNYFSSNCDPGYGVLRYSPGYCGWHVSGQINLFKTLTPEKIGITLGESCLMNPLKSVSGVLVAGPPNIHKFTVDYDFCIGCADHQCRDRINQVLSRSRKES